MDYWSSICHTPDTGVSQIDWLLWKKMQRTILPFLWRTLSSHRLLQDNSSPSPDNCHYTAHQSAVYSWNEKITRVLWMKYCRDYSSTQDKGQRAFSLHGHYCHHVVISFNYKMNLFFFFFACLFMNIVIESIQRMERKCPSHTENELILFSRQAYTHNELIPFSLDRPIPSLTLSYS